MYDIITFDCYGTLIDWDLGITRAMNDIADSIGARIQREDVIRAYHEAEPEIQASEYRSYADVLRDTAIKTGQVLGFQIDEKTADRLAKSLPGWPPFADTNPALEELKRDGYQLGILSNIDNDLLAGTLTHFCVEFDFFVTAEQVRSYKPGFAHFLRAREQLAGANWLHAAQSFFHDVRPAAELGIPVVWVNRKQEEGDGDVEWIGEVPTLLDFVDWLRKGGAQG